MNSVNWHSLSLDPVCSQLAFLEGSLKSGNQITWEISPNFRSTSAQTFILIKKYLKSIVSVKIEIASVHQGSFELVFIKFYHYLSLRYFSRTLVGHVMKTFLTRSERCWASSLQLGFLTKMSFVWNFKFRSADNWIEMSQNSNCIKMQNDLNRKIKKDGTDKPTN